MEKFEATRERKTKSEGGEGCRCGASGLARVKATMEARVIATGVLALTSARTCPRMAGGDQRDMAESPLPRAVADGRLACPCCGLLADEAPPGW